MDQCFLCRPAAEQTFLQNDLGIAYWDAFPVAERHALIVPRRHVADYFSLTPEELLACHGLLRQARELICAADRNVTGFNIGANIGEAAGQTVFHCHIHLIPRRLGDVTTPRGGVRNIIPGRGDY